MTGWGDMREPARRLGRRPRRVQVLALEGDDARPRMDRLAVEEPLEIRVAAGDQRRTLAITMRTPGEDFALAAGFLFGEGVIAGRDEIVRISYCIDPHEAPDQRYNIVLATLRNRQLPQLAALERHFVTTSACGVCGKAGLETLRLRGYQPLAAGVRVPASWLYTLPERMRAAQAQFAQTGGLHAAALFVPDDATGLPLRLSEDVGRHNALDKLIGQALLDGQVPLDGRIIMVSGRLSYELVQKCLVAGVPIICGVSAPSSLAVDLARAFNITLVGFLRGTRANVYTVPERIALA